jgi:putative transposase
MHGRKLQFAAGCYYHLYNRGANRHSIFVTDHDYSDFLARLQKYAALHATTLIAYCLMPNHFHLLVRQQGEDRSGLTAQLACNGYTQAFNRRHEHSGTLFQGRYQRILVDSDEYLRHLCRYIHTNPVKDGFALQPELWPYSNYVDWISPRPGAQVDSCFVAEFFGSTARYQQFVAAWSARRQMPDPLQEYLAALERAE